MNETKHALDIYIVTDTPSVVTKVDNFIANRNLEGEFSDGFRHATTTDDVVEDERWRGFGYTFIRLTIRYNKISRAKRDTFIETLKTGIKNIKTDCVYILITKHHCENYEDPKRECSTSEPYEYTRP